MALFYCYSCGMPEGLYCDMCAAKLQPLHQSFPCAYVDTLTAVCQYKDPGIQELITAAKIQKNKEARQTCLRLFVTPHEGVCVTVVPTGRLQSLFSGKHIMEEIGRKYDAKPILARSSWHKKQRNKSKQERQKISGFYLLPGVELPSSVCIIDDVYTTGATLNACARILKEAGVKKVHASVLAINTLS